MKIKKTGRPKGDNKEKITLSIRPASIVKGKKSAKLVEKSLSQFTEDMYNSMHDDFFGMELTAEEKMSKIERDMEDLRNKIKTAEAKKKS